MVARNITRIMKIDWRHIADGFSPGVPCLVATKDSEMIRYQVAVFEVGRGWRNQFRDKVHNVIYWAYITDLPKEEETT